MWSGITGEFMKHWILKAERQQKKFLSEGYTHNVSVDCSGRGWRSD
jgi:hypothetical protein